VTFDVSSLSSTYKHLQLRIVSRMGGTGGARSNTLRFNSDTGSNYRSHFLIGNGANAGSFESGSATRIFLGIAGNTAQTYEFGGSIVDILDPFSSTKNKTVRSLGGLKGGGTEIGLISGLYLSTSAITGLTVIPETGDFQVGSRFSLYGIKG
jgi:hypothetical protein